MDNLGAWSDTLVTVVRRMGEVPWQGRLQVIWYLIQRVEVIFTKVNAQVIQNWAQ